MISIIINILVGSLFLFLGFLLFKKEKISLIHAYHYDKVKEEDKADYTKLMGKAFFIMGIGFIIAAILYYFKEFGIGDICTVISLLISFIIMNKAQQKYNNGWF